MPRSCSSFLTSKNMCDPHLLLDSGHILPLEVYKAPQEDRVPIFVITKVPEIFLEYYIPKEVYDIFEPHIDEFDLVTNTDYFMSLLIMYFVSFFPDSLKKEDETIDAEYYMFTLCTSNDTICNPCIFTNSDAGVDSIKKNYSEWQAVPDIGKQLLLKDLFAITNNKK